jgi:hypothetical protein
MTLSVNRRAFSDTEEVTAFVSLPAGRLMVLPVPDPYAFLKRLPHAQNHIPFFRARQVVEKPSGNNAIPSAACRIRRTDEWHML